MFEFLADRLVVVVELNAPYISFNRSCQTHHILAKTSFSPQLTFNIIHDTDVASAGFGESACYLVNTNTIVVVSDALSTAPFILKLSATKCLSREPTPCPVIGTTFHE